MAKISQCRNIRKNVPCESVTVLTENIIPNPTQKRPSRHAILGKGLSNTLHLTASLKINISQNGEGQAFILEKRHSEKAVKGGKSSSKNRSISATKKNGLSSRAKRNIRVISDCYNALVTDQEFYDRHHLEENLYNPYCRFITLTFRQFIPDDKTAKTLIHNFFKRLRRHKKRNFHYVWVAEIQVKRRLKTGVRAIHFHILTPEKIYNDSLTDTSEKIRLEENKWVNKAWNEVVANWALKAGHINKAQRKEWQSEYKLSENYYSKLVAFRTGQTNKQPRRPKKSKYMVLPNCVHVGSAGAYMSKYMSKENENIVGGMYDASKYSRDFLPKKDLVVNSVANIYLGNKMIEWMQMRAIQERVYTSNWELEFNESKGVWCKDGYRLLEWYYEFVEAEKLNPRIWVQDFR